MQRNNFFFPPTKKKSFFSPLSGKLDEGESFKGNMPLTPLSTLSQYPMDLIWSFLSINACKTQIVSRISIYGLIKDPCVSQK